ncbi:hypothetical protein ACFSSA_11230 [Luteolibacter algae]|uniref:Uncharacterized protein n=1 Tax=Luteolibacter algae TaxID=454151 RepID=A0ABW5D852_9BACT
MKFPPHDSNQIVLKDGLEKTTWKNGDRAKSASDAIHYYGHQRGTHEDIETLSVDLISDVLHLLHSKGVDVDKVLRASKTHFETEVAK